MEGVIDLAEEIFHMPVRLGMPHGIQGLSDIVNNPIYSTGVGLLLYGLQQQQENRHGAGKAAGNGWLGRLRKWFQNNL